MKQRQWIYTSKETGERFAVKELSGDTESGQQLLAVHTGRKRQQILGFGGAFTDTSAMALMHMSPKLQEEALTAYFDTENGLGYNMGRVPVGGCDFSSVPYSEDETAGDTALEDFTIEQDRRGILPLIRAAKEKMREDTELLLYALPWSPPGWMKTNGKMNWGGALLPEYYPVMAEYLVKFLRAYDEEGVHFWGMAPQNEPTEVQRWPSCEYSGVEEQRFLKQYLIPTLGRAGYGNLKLLFWDCNKDLLRSRAREMLSDPEIYHAVFGAAFHWYSGDYFEELDAVHEEFPDTQLLSTECCVVMPEDLQDWSVGERYAHDMIGNFNHWTCAWMDWNLYLDQNSGPGIADNPCAAPIILDEARQKVIRMSSYYYVGHFSRYVHRGANVLETEAEMLEGCAFENPDGSIAAVLMNRSNATVKGNIFVDGKPYCVELGPHSIGTLLLERA